MHQLIPLHKPNKNSEEWEDDGLAHSSNQTPYKSPWHDAAVCAEMPGVVFDSIAKRFYFEAQYMLRIACLGMLRWNINTNNTWSQERLPKSSVHFFSLETPLPLPYNHQVSSKRNEHIEPAARQGSKSQHISRIIMYQQQPQIW
jgi:hypothetical protein